MAENHLTGTMATPPSEHDGGFPPFQRDTFASQLLWLAIFFVALYFIAYKLALPRVGSIIADRRKRIAGEIAAAARMKDAAVAPIATYEREWAASAASFMRAASARSPEMRLRRSAMIDPTRGR